MTPANLPSGITTSVSRFPLLSPVVTSILGYQQSSSLHRCSRQLCPALTWASTCHVVHQREQPLLLFLPLGWRHKFEFHLTLTCSNLVEAQLMTLQSTPCFVVHLWLQLSTPECKKMIVLLWWRQSSDGVQEHVAPGGMRTWERQECDEEIKTCNGQPEVKWSGRKIFCSLTLNKILANRSGLKLFWNLLMVTTNPERKQFEQRVL